VFLFHQYKIVCLLHYKKMEVDEKVELQSNEVKAKQIHSPSVSHKRKKRKKQPSSPISKQSKNKKKKVKRIKPIKVQTKDPNRGFWNENLAKKATNVWLPVGVVPDSIGSSNPISSFQTKRLKVEAQEVRQPLDVQPQGRVDVEETKRMANKKGIKARVKSTNDEKTPEEAESEKQQLKEWIERKQGEKLTQDEREKYSKSYQRSRKILLNPNSTQYDILMRWMQDYRATYNRALGDLLRINKHRMMDTEKGSMDKLMCYLTNKFVTGENVEKSAKWDYLVRTPADIRKGAVRELISHCKTFKTNFKNRVALREKYPNVRRFQKDYPFHLGFKSRKEFTSDSFDIEQKSYRFKSSQSFSLYPGFKSSTLSMGETKTMMHDINIYQSKDVNHKFTLTKETVSSDIKIHYSYGKFYLLAPYVINVKQNVTSTSLMEMQVEGVEYNKHTEKWQRENGPSSRHLVGAIDPGVRKPFTVYSPEEQVEIFGCNSNKIIDQHLWRVERTKEKRDSQVKILLNEKNDKNLRRTRKEKMKRRVMMRKANQKYVAAREKMQDVVKNFHYNVAHRLCRGYKTILLPTYSAKNMSRKMGRKIGKQVVKRMQALSFYKFSQRLKQVASLYPGCTILRGSEAYTSKTCGKCGVLCEDLGGDETFECQECGLVCDRDIHASRNVYLRFLNIQVIQA
jgi:transposase